MAITDMLEGHTRRGWQSIDLGKYGPAIKEFKEALSINPNNASARLGIGYAYLEKDDLKSAKPEIETALKLDPDDPDCYNTLSRWHYRNADNKKLMFKTREYEDALTYIKKAIELKPENPNLHTNAGLYLLLMKRYDLAEKELNKSLNLNPNLDATHINLHLLYYDTGDKEKSAYHLKEAMRLSPNEVIAHHNLGRVYLSQGKNAEAVESARNALLLNPNYKPSELLLINALTAKGNLFYALYLKYCYAVENYNIFIRLFLGWILARIILVIVVGGAVLIASFLPDVIGDVVKLFGFLLFFAIIISTWFPDQVLMFLYKRGWIK